MTTKERKRHASVSIDNRHACNSCFTCACVEIQRELDNEAWLRRRDQVRMSDVRAAHPVFFDRKTCRMFGDVSYKLLTAKSGKKYMVRLTAQWSDMFGSPKYYRYRLNPIGPRPELKIENLVDQEFASVEDVKDWLKEH